MLAIVLLALGGAGCALAAGEAGERVADAELSLEAKNGIEMNGTQINGELLNGVKLNGVKLNGVKLNGVKMNGTELEGTPAGSSSAVSGEGFEGADMQAVLADGTILTVHVASVSTTEVPGLYTYVVLANGESICGYDVDGNPISAIPLEGTWNYVTGDHVDSPSQFTMACRGAALAKCVEWGYPRWDGWQESNGQSTQSVPFRYFHDACVRMVRADYCGDGVSHTIDGTTVDVWDAAGIQTQTPGLALLPEAEWSPGGATCVKRTRYAALNGVSVQQYIQTHCPSRWAGTSGACMGDASGGSLFFTQNGFGTPSETRPLLRNASGEAE
ncbi:ADYC domain-containing protein [Polyangium aurulentum]|uniref:ADYC domain-containing protein n=1 Tax=Polyangium aurulentum TaxID=2567896 RepID=UPI0010ADBF6E|nr:ADYC domain-containing protein [Polyangium aurulentum]UQA54812.1 pentapeptide repeat-containing protein [Polyangium aurulentum]